MDAAILKETDFPEPDREAWLALARKALGDADFETALVSRSDDGFPIEPLYAPDTSARVLARDNTSGRWKILQRLDDPDPARANRQALTDVEQGADGLSIVFSGSPNAFGFGLPANPEALSTALADVPLNRTHLRINVHPQGRALVDWMVEILTARRADPSKLSVSFGVDPAAVFAGTGGLRMSVEALEASMPQSLAHFFALGLPGVLLQSDGRVFHNGGATEAQELGAMMASAVAYMRMFEMARQPLVYAAPHIGFALGADQDQFTTMAKIRALRLLWSRVQEACGIEPGVCEIHAETSYRMITARDFETNILRNTIAAFAAVVGGADTISVLPHTIAHGLPDAFARRVARNTQLVINGESRAGFVVDPAAGAGGIEALTDALCEHAWGEFRTIENEGGILRSLEAGKLQERIAASADERLRAYREGKRSIVGTTAYPAASERPVSVLDAARSQETGENAATCRPLSPARIDEGLGETS